ncbi:MAG: hypothetical protein CHACPFDD_03495 [Phycisphaerae bacterium]|nr:hypothetical protein [Phycisphaerae bacterium]
MAGRPAPRRSPGAGLSGLHYGLITSIVISVAAVGAFIWQLTNVKGIESERDRFKRLVTEYGEPPDYYRNEATARGSRVFDVLDKDRSTFAKLVTGEATTVAAGAEAQVDAVLSQVATNHPKSVTKSDALLTAVRRLDKLLADEKRTSGEANRKLDEVRGENLTLTRSIKAVQDDFQAQVAGLNDRLTQLQAQVRDFQTKKDDQLNTIQQSFVAHTEQKLREDQERRRKQKELELEIARLQGQVGEFRRVIEELKPTSFDPNEILAKADGRVSRAVPGSDVVYVNLGEVDGIKIGMGFEVFSAARESSEALRGKASIEVVTVLEHSAECKVTRLEHGRPIIEGDVIVNITYERNRRPRFVVAGAFDLNYDGVDDFDGAERIKSMIREWGGETIDELDERTDFVVIGGAPRIPDVSDGTTEVVGEQVRDRKVKLGEFRDLINRARASFVPVITQNQFLFLTGYAGDTNVVARR